MPTVNFITSQIEMYCYIPIHITRQKNFSLYLIKHSNHGKVFQIKVADVTDIYILHLAEIFRTLDNY